MKVVFLQSGHPWLGASHRLGHLFGGSDGNLLTQDILDDKTDTTTNKNVEARGQGIANIVSSLFGGMAGCALVVSP